MREMLKRKKIKDRLSTGYMIVIGLMVVSGILAIIGLTLLNSGLTDFVEGANTADSAVKICRIDINIAARNIREAALNDESQLANYKSKVEEKMAEVDEQLAILKKTGIVDDTSYQNYVNAIDEWSAEGYGILNYLEEGDYDTAKNKILNECVPALNELITLSNELDDQTDVSMQSSILKSQIIFFTVMAVIIVLVIIAVIISRKIGSIIVASIMEPLYEIEDVAAKLTEGNLHSHLEYHSEDEIGHLAHSLRKSIRILGSYVDDIAHAMGEFSEGNFAVQPTVEWKGDFVTILEAFMSFEKSMANTVKSIHNVASQVEGGSGQVADSSNELAQGASEQASITEELAAMIANVSEQVAFSAESAKDMIAKVSETEATVLTGNEKMQEMVESMNEINEASQEIRKIIDTI